MQVKLIALAVAGLMAAPAFAQSNVTVYGRVDMGYQQWTHDGKAATLDEESRSRWGLIGEEDLGGGLKAFFQLENRFFLDDGTVDGVQWKDKAFVGLAGGFGKVSFGRVHTVNDTLHSETFGGDTIASFGSRRAKTVAIINNGMLYESPKLGGVVTGFAHFGFNENTDGGKSPFGVGARYSASGLVLDLSWQKDVSDTTGGGTPTAKGAYTTWQVAGNYDFQVAKVFFGYASSDGYDTLGVNNENAKMTRYHVGVQVPMGNGTVMGNIGRGTETDAANVKLPSFTHLGVGYWYNLSKRTILMANFAYEKQKDTFGPAKDEDNRLGYQFAVRHSF